jgi:transposase
LAALWEHPGMSTNRRRQQAQKRATRERAVRQARRERAAELFAQGASQAEVARQLDVSRQSASRWHAGWQANGTAALRTRGPTGRRPKVADEQLETIEQALLEGALAHGFPSEVWTLDRIALVIQGLTGAALSNPSVWRLLRGRLGWTVQRPARQAKERDEQAIQHWVAHEWPRIKKGQPQNRPGSSSSTNRASR